MFMQLLLKVLTTQAAKTLAIYLLQTLAKRTDNTVDDELVTLASRVMGGLDTSTAAKVTLKQEGTVGGA